MSRFINRSLLFRLSCFIKSESLRPFSQIIPHFTPKVNHSFVQLRKWLILHNRMQNSKRVQRELESCIHFCLDKFTGGCGRGPHVAMCITCSIGCCTPNKLVQKDCAKLFDLQFSGNAVPDQSNQVGFQYSSAKFEMVRNRRHKSQWDGCVYMANKCYRLCNKCFCLSSCITSGNSMHQYDNVTLSRTAAFKYLL
jgi:hypothetical protein